jgi:hypothetical protein
MKLQLLILIFILPIITFSQSFEWLSKASFDTISHVGNKYFFIQHCSKEMDSLLVTGKALFRHANVKHIGLCKLTHYYQDTIYYKATIEINSSKQHDDLFLYFKTLSKGNYHEQKLGSKMIYTGKFVSKEGISLVATLIVNKRKKKALLMIE